VTSRKTPSAQAFWVAALLTPFSRGRRAIWGAGADGAARRYPGDELVPEPRWGWTHAIQVEAPAADVWPWVTQIGKDAELLVLRHEVAVRRRTHRPCGRRAPRRT
jgi:hypothetical protein